MAEMQELPPPDQQGQQEEEMDAQENVEEAGGVRNFRPRRMVYSEKERERAIKMLENGVPCREVAKSLGPRCSSGTPIRWRKLQIKQNESRRLMEEMMKRPGNAFNNH